MRILIIEDNDAQRELLSSLLQNEGFDTDQCADGEEGLYVLRSGSFDLAIVDRMLPKRDGLTLLRIFRQSGGNTPVILLTALSAVGDRVAGLDAGADDYLVKPFAPEELLARVRALLRRPAPFHSNVLAWADVRFFMEECRLEGPAGSASLSAREAGLVQMLLANPGQTLTRETILLRVWGMSSEVEERNIDNFVYLVRRRLRNVGSSLRIATVRGVGYRLEKDYAE